MWSFQLTGPASLAKVRVTAPEPGSLSDGEVLVRLEAGGLCGSDFSYFKGLHTGVVATTEPSDYGACLHGASMHEMVGEVLASRDPEICVGRRVVGWATAMNALSEFVVTSGDSLAEYDVDLPPCNAVMLQPLACVLYAVDRLSAAAAARVAVLGLGPIGLLFCHVLKSVGATHVVGVDRVDRSDVAELFGIDELVHASTDRWVLGLSPDQQPAVVIEAIGHQVSTLTAAVRAVAPKGEIFYFGVPDDDIYPISMIDMLRKDLTLRSGTTWDRRSSLRRADAYLQRYPELAQHYVSHVFPVSEAQAAYEAAIRPASGQLKIVLKV